MANELIDKKAVRAEMEDMISMITHPEFVAAMKTMKETPVSKRREIGKKILTVKALAKKGVPIPADMRVTTRYFEKDRPEVIEIRPDGTASTTKYPKYSMIENSIAGMACGGCACGGAATVCGGAGSCAI